MTHGDPTIEVTYLLFSGRRNPTWVMNDEQIQRFRGMITSLPLANPRPLGWQGFLARNYNNVPDVPDQIVVHDGIVDITRGRTTTPHVDQQNLADWLREQSFKSPIGSLVREVLEKRGVWA